MSQLSELLASHTGPVLFVVIFAEMMGCPFPAASVLVAAGALAANGSFSPAVAIGITVAACVLGDSIWFFGGRQRGSRVLQLPRRHDSVDGGRTRRLFARYGSSAVAGAKFIPGVGFLIPAFAGAFRMPFGKFVCFDVLGSLLYAIVYMQLGFAFSSEITGALDSLSKFGLHAGVIAAAVFAAYKYTQHRKRTAIARSAPGTVIAIPAMIKEETC